MTLTEDEQAMILAYRAGRQHYLDVPRHSIETLGEAAGERYRSTIERDCFFAGYMSERFAEAAREEGDE